MRESKKKSAKFRNCSESSRGGGEWGRGKRRKKEEKRPFEKWG